MQDLKGSRVCDVLYNIQVSRQDIFDKSEDNSISLTED